MAGPNVRQRRVAARLRRWRHDSDSTLDDVSSRLRWSKAKLSKFERAELNAGPAEVIALAMVHGIPDQERDETMALAVAALEDPGWWHAYTPEVVPNFLADYLEAEREASTLRDVAVQLVPGLLQTDEYTDALMRSWHPRPDGAVLENRLAVRKQRQARLDEPASLTVHALIHEAALLPAIGGANVMAAQLDHLIERAKQQHVTVQVIPNAAGAYPGMATAYSVLTYDGNESAAVYIENLGDGLYMEDDPRTARYVESFGLLANEALDTQASIHMLDQTRKGWAE